MAECGMDRCENERERNKRDVRLEVDQRRGGLSWRVWYSGD